tara:strand:- start:5 stop:877 length:873 start_codon:yes stop_codon:yes gene_type:complete
MSFKKLIKQHLQEHGWIIIPDVLTEEEIDHAKASFYSWQKTIPNHDIIHNKCDPHGIYKHHEAGHQYHSWYIRTRPAVQHIFKTIWDCENLIVSFDGSCYIDKKNKKKDNIWTHTDQAPATKGLSCYQGLVSLTSNKERTLVVYDKSHLLHEKYFKEQNNTSKNNWNLIDHETLDALAEHKMVLEVPAGALAIWDSRTFHQNQYGAPESEERIVQYVCYLPREHEKNTEAMKRKRLKYYLERRTTSHWPAPIHVNGKQPQTFGNKSLQIDYSSLTPPDLSNLEEEIQTLL